MAVKNSGCIIERKNSYSIILNLGRDPVTRKRKQQWVTFKGSLTEARKKQTELQRQIDTGTYAQPGKLTVGEFLNKWLSDYARPNLSPRSFERYTSVVRLQLSPGIGNVQLSKLTPGHIQALYASLSNTLSARTIQFCHIVLHRALGSAVKWGLIMRNPADNADVPRGQRKEMQVWDEAEIGQFLTEAKRTQYYPLFFCALYTGMRRSELLALTWGDIDFVYSQISVKRGLHQLKDNSYVFTNCKTQNSKRNVKMSPVLYGVLEAYHVAKEFEAKQLDVKLSDDDLVFSSIGKAWRPNSISRAWHNLAVKAGVKPIRFHDARHTHASLLLKQNTHPAIVMQRLGHSTISTTIDVYSHIMPGLQEAAVLGFDKMLERTSVKSG
jgi:integrase